MKPSAIIWFASLVLACPPAAATDFVRQIQMVGEALVVTDFPVSDLQGEVMSKALDSELSVFQLYAEHAKADRSIGILKLDEKSVGTFLPEVTITTFSEDPHVPTRTRADRPYGVRVTVRGMLDGGMVPDYAKSVMLGRSYKLYSPNTYVFNGVEGEYEDVQSVQRNGTFEDPAVIQQLPAPSPLRAVGEETFAAHVHPEAGSGLAELASATVTIWPVATARIDGIEEGAVYKSTPQSAAFTLNDAYPRSITYAQIYKGPEKLGTTGTVLDHTVTEYGGNGQDHAVPQNTRVALGDFSSHALEDGEYTIEVLTITPFNNGAKERIARVSFLIDRTISVNSMVTTIE